jgi:hypothetical protein
MMTVREYCILLPRLSALTRFQVVSYSSVTRFVLKIKGPNGEVIRQQIGIL